MSATDSDEGAKAKETEAKVMREGMLRILLTSEARQRLANVKMVRPDVAKSIEDQLIQLGATGKIRKAITDEELKQLLSTFNQPKKEFKIRWI